MSKEIYISGHVQQIQTLYKPIIENLSSYPTLKKQLKAFLSIAFDSYKAGELTYAIEFSNHHPNWLGKYEEIIAHKNHSWEDFELVIARGYGFKNWDEVTSNGNQSFDIDFENAITFLIHGDINELQSLIDNQPTVLQTKSIYGHRASLIHYIGSNGLEIWRQQVPMNLPSILRMLLNAGSHSDPKNKIYGNGSHLIDLIESSDHPNKTGFTKELVDILRDHKTNFTSA